MQTVDSACAESMLMLALSATFHEQIKQTSVSLFSVN